MKLTLYIIITIFSVATRAQTVEDPVPDLQLEELAEWHEREPEDEGFQQQLERFHDKPLNLNDPDIGDADFPLLTPLLLHNLLEYRRSLGDLVAIHELQAVPGFTVSVIKNLLPFIYVEAVVSKNILRNVSESSQQMILRPSAMGKTYVRYKYIAADDLQFGGLAERDAGERSYFDFTSFHLFMRGKRLLKTAAFGDYSLNMGQGLIHWQSQAFNKGSSVVNVKRQSPVFRPYLSAGEYNFQRGGAMMFELRQLSLTVFGSYRKLTANTGTDSAMGSVITSLNTSGIHTTVAELARKNNVGLRSFGAVCAFRMKRGTLAVNGISYKYSLPLLKRDDPYNLYAVKGQGWANYSVDFAFTVRNAHVFGEVAVDRHANRAVLGGAMASLNSLVDVAVLIRSISPAYQSFYGNAFTENTLPANEDGCYVGVVVRPDNRWQVDLYADRFRFPWLKYRIDAPSTGYAHFVQVTWRPSRAVELYGRYRVRSKALNAGKGPVQFPANHVQKNWRGHLSINLSRSLEFRTRTEVCVFEEFLTGNPANGFLVYAEMHWRPERSWYGANMRVLSYETDSYDARVYAYENDVPYSSAIPAFYGKGWRIYLNVHFRPRIRLPGGWVTGLSGKVLLNRGHRPGDSEAMTETFARLQLTFTRASGEL